MMLVNALAKCVPLISGCVTRESLEQAYEEPTTAADPLLARGNVIVTPHIAGGSRWNRLADFEEMLTAIAETLRSH